MKKKIIDFIKNNAKGIAIFFVSNIIIAILSSVVTLKVNSYYEDKANWKKIDTSVNELMYKIILAENDPTLKVPAHSATNLEKINFIRQNQIERHFSSWNLVKAHLPAVSLESTLDEWSSAISGHESIEKNNHANFASLDKRAEYLALYSSLESQSVVEMPIKTLASIYKMASVSSDNCPNCMKAREEIQVHVSKELEDSGKTVMGIAVAALPNNKKRLPVIDLKSPEISALIKNQNIDITTKQRYFLPTYETLELIQNSGGSIRAFENDVKAEKVPAEN